MLISAPMCGWNGTGSAFGSPNALCAAAGAQAPIAAKAANRNAGEDSLIAASFGGFQVKGKAPRGDCSDFTKGPFGQPGFDLCDFSHSFSARQGMYSGINGAPRRR